MISPSLSSRASSSASRASVLTRSPEGRCSSDGAATTLKAFADGGGELTFLGVPVIMVSYLSAVIPTIVAVWILSLVERFLTRWIPETIRNFAVPMLAVAIVVPVTFLAVGPASYYLGDALSNGVNWLWNLSPALGGFILGGTWELLVIFGLHWGFVPVIIQDIASQGYSVFTGALFPAVLAITGGTLGVAIDLLKQKGVKEENIIVASICTAPEGLLVLNEKFPSIKVVMVVMDDYLNERKYIVPGLGDFGDRFFGTVH